MHGESNYLTYLLLILKYTIDPYTRILHTHTHTNTHTHTHTHRHTQVEGSRPRWSRGNVPASRSKVRGFKPD